MAELKTKKFVFNADGKTHVITGSRFEDILTAMGITELRFYELLSRDAYCPTLSAAPSTSTLTYTDTDGSTNHFHVGQLCRWAEDGIYQLAVCEDITSTSSSWHVIQTPQDVTDKQDKLVSGTNIKTINGVSLLGPGDIGMIWTTETNGVDYPSVTIN